MHIYIYTYIYISLSLYIYIHILCCYTKHSSFIFTDPPCHRQQTTTTDIFLIEQFAEDSRGGDCRAAWCARLSCNSDSRSNLSSCPGTKRQGDAQSAGTR